MHITDYPVTLGDTTVLLRVFENGPGPTLIRVHEDETDAGAAGIRMIMERGGRFIDLEHGNTRLVHFALGGVTYEFDPNRIFTPEGIVRTLHAQGKPDMGTARAAVQKLAESIRSLCGDAQPLIALHNNRGTGFGLRWYEKGGIMYRGEGKTYSHRGTAGTQDLAVVTSRSLFEAFAQQNFSVAYVLPKFDLNDGSLSYVYGRDGLAYINIESKFGDLEEEWRMVRFAYQIAHDALHAEARAQPEAK